MPSPAAHQLCSTSPLSLRSAPLTSTRDRCAPRALLTWRHKLCAIYPHCESFTSAACSCHAATQFRVPPGRGCSRRRRLSEFEE
jgi:hypothetical protein